VAGTLATLLVKLRGDSSDLRKEFSNVEGHANKTGGVLKGALSTGLGFGAATLAMAGFGSALDLVGHGAIGMNAQLETSTLQFATLMGDSDKARKHVEGLFDFAAKTPFETGPIIEASRIMETFGGSALNSKENLKLFGDAAAATSAPINEVGFWMSRAYSDIQAGRPFGEAAARLSELGLITPKTRNKLEDLQKSGASSDKVWNTLTGTLGRFDGAMEKQAGTFDGMVSTFMDGINMMMAQAFKPLFETLKDVLSGVNNLMASEAFQGGVKAAGEAMASGIKAFVDILGKLWDIAQPIISTFLDIASALFEVGSAVSTGATDPLTALMDTIDGVVDTLFGFGGVLDKLMGQALEFASTIQDHIVEAFNTLMKTLPSVLDGLAELFPPILTKVLAFILEWAPRVAEQMMAFVGGMIDAFVDNLPALLTAVSGFFQAAFDWVVNTGVPMAAAAIGPLALKFIDWIGVMLPKLAAALPPIIGTIIGFIAKNLPVLIGKLIEWGGAFIGWIGKNVMPRLPGALATIGRALLGFIGNAARTFLGALATLGSNVLASVGRWGGQMATNLGNFAKQAVNNAITWFTSLPGKLMTFLGQVIRNIATWGGNLLRGALNAARNFVAGFINGLTSLPGKLANAIRSAFANLRIDVGPFHISGSGISIDMPNISLPKFATGAWDTGSRPFLGQLDPHEMIIPKGPAEALRSLIESSNRGGAPTSSQPVMRATSVEQGASQTAMMVLQVNIKEFYGTKDAIDDFSNDMADSLRIQRMPTGIRMGSS
jgi:phage-related protein